MSVSLSADDFGQSACFRCRPATVRRRATRSAGAADKAVAGRGPIGGAAAQLRGAARFVCEELEKRWLLSTVTWTGAAGDGLWTDGGNWSNPGNPGAIPGANDDAVINLPGAQVSVSSDQSVAGLTTAAGTSLELARGGLTLGADPSNIAGSLAIDNTLTTGSGAVTLAGATAFNRGGLLQLGGTPVTNTGTMTVGNTGSVLNSSNNPGLISGTLANQGTIQLSPTGLGVQGGAVLDNQAAGIIDFQSDVSVGGGFGGTVQNEGLIEKTGGTGASAFFVNLTSSGNVAAHSGALVLSNGNGVTTLNGGNFVSDADTSITLAASGGTTDVTGTLAGSGAGQVTTGFGTINTGAGGATFNFPAGLFTWTGIINTGAGPLTNIGTITTAAASNGNGSTLQSGTLANQGTLNLDSTVQDLGMQSGAGQTALLDNQAGGVLDVLTDQSVRGAGGNNAVQNEGTIEKTGGSGTSLFNVPLTNTGTVHGVTGTLGLTGSSSVATLNGGVYDADAGAAVDLAFNGEAVLTGTLTGSGAGAVMFPFTNSADSFAVGVGGATLDFPGNLFQWAGGSLTTSSGDLTNTGTINFTAAGSVQLLGGGTLFDRGTFIQSGTGDLSLHSDSSGQFATTVNVAAGASYLIESDAGIDNAAGGASALTNAGTIEKTAGGGNSPIILNGPLSNTGSIIAASGAISLTGLTTIAQLSSGTLSGGTWQALNGATLNLPGGTNITTNQANLTLSGATASISGLSNLAANSGGITVTNGATLSTTGSFDNSGTVNLGPAGHLSVGGGFSQEPAGTLAVQLGSPPAGGQFGAVSSAASASLHGTLQVSLVNGYNPAAGDSFQVMSFPGHAGSFDNIQQPLFRGGDLFQVQTNPTSVTIGAAKSVADLVTSGVSVSPNTATVGQNITVNFQVANHGQAAPATLWNDAVFLTTGTTLGPGAVLLGRAPHNGPLGSGGTYGGSLTVPLPAILPGTYHVIVEADSQGFVPDGNRDNNLAVGAATLQAIMPTLTLAPAGGTPTPVGGTIKSGQIVAYQLVVPVPQVVQLTADTGAVGGADLLASPGTIPTESGAQGYTFAATQKHQQLTLNATRAGTYYIVLHGQPGAGAGTSYTLTAQTLPFQVTAASPGSVGNTGTVTLEISGAQLASTDSFTLLGPGGASFTDSAAYPVDATGVFATFDLTGAPLGTYDLRATDPTGQAATLPQSVTVQPGQPGFLDTQVQVPGSQRLGRAVNGEVFYENTGNVDVPAPLFILETDNPSLLLATATAGSLSNDPQFILGLSSQGPAGVLRPGQAVQTGQGIHGEFLPFQELALTEGGDPAPDGDNDDNGSGGPPPAPQTVTLLVEDANSTDEVDYAGLANSLGLAQTDPVMKAIEADAGPTWGGLVRLLDKSATNAVAEGDAIHSATDVFEQLIEDEIFKVEGGVSGHLYLNDNVHPLAGALITLVNADGSRADGTTSKSDGSFVLPAMPADTYQLEVDGFLLPQPVQVTVTGTGSVNELSVIVKRGGSIGGVVSDAADGNAQGGVPVIALSDQQVSFVTQTNADGTYVFSGLPDGTYTVTAGGNGFDRKASQPQSIVSSGSATGVNFALDASAALSGVVVRAQDRAPVAGATVLVTDAAGNALVATTAADGTYTLPGLAPGNESITMKQSGFAPSAPLTVNAAPGATATVDPVSLAAASTLNIAVTDTSGKPIPGASLTLLRGGQTVDTNDADNGGTATFTDLSAGLYTLQATADGFFTGTASVTLTIGTATPQPLALAAGGVIQGQVKDAAGTALGNVPVLMLRQDGAAFTTSTDANGLFAINSLHAPGNYAVSVGAAPGVLRQDVNLSGAAPQQTVAFTLPGFDVTGSVFKADGVTPAGGVNVFLNQGGQQLVAATTDRNGSYEFEGVLAGSYTVQASDFASLSPAQTFSIGSANATVSALTLGNLALTGSVADAHGAPVAGAVARLTSQLVQGETLLFTATTANDGGFSLSGLAPGNYKLLVTAEGFAPHQQAVTVTAGGGSAQIALQPAVTSTFQGTVTDAAGQQPLGNALVQLYDPSTGALATGALTDAKGQFTIADVPVGTYDVLVGEPSHQLTLLTGLVIGTSTVTRDVALAGQTTQVLGSVMDDRGVPVAGADVSVVGSHNEVVFTAPTAFDGSYALGTLPAGTYTIVVTANGYHAATANNVTVTAGQTTSVDRLTLQTAGADDFTNDQLAAFLGNVSGVLAALVGTSDTSRDPRDPGDGQPPIPDPPNAADCPDILSLEAQARRFRDFKDQLYKDFLSKDAQFRTAVVESAAVYLLDVANFLAQVASIPSVAGKLVGVNPNDLNRALQIALQGSNLIGRSSAAVAAILSQGPALITNIGQAYDTFKSAFTVPTVRNPDGSLNVKGVTDSVNQILDFTASLGSVTASGVTLLQFLEVFGGVAANSPAGKVLNTVIPGFSALTALFDTVNHLIHSGQDLLNAIHTEANSRANYVNALNRMLGLIAAINKAAADCDPTKPKPPPMPPNPKDAGKGGADSDKDIDPNAIAGPAGYAAPEFVAPAPVLPYRIDFENEPIASAAAAVVTVTQHLDPGLDLSTFQLGQFGFGGQVFDVPAGMAAYSTTVHEAAGTPGAGPDGLDVQVQASLDAQSRTVTWTFTSIDPATQDVPIDASVGFLPPDVNGPVGEGFVTYTVQSLAGLPTGTAIPARASVVFDQNAPLPTNVYTNTIDAGAPTSHVNPLPAAEDRTEFPVTWSGLDDAGGSGIASYTIYVSDNGGPFAPWLTNTTATSALYPGQNGHSYAFYSVATDHVGNIEAAHAQPDTQTTVSVGAAAVVAVTVTDGVAADGTTQRSEVRQLLVQFNQPVSLAAGAFSLALLNTGGSGTNDGSLPADASAALGTPTTSDGGVTWVIPVLANTAFTDATGSLADGIYTLTTHAAAVSVTAGQPMAGDSSLTFHRLFGDADGNKTVNALDYAKFKAAFGATAAPAYNPLFDSDANGAINALDYAQFKAGFGRTFTY